MSRALAALYLAAIVLSALGGFIYMNVACPVNVSVPIDVTLGCLLFPFFVFSVVWALDEVFGE